MSDFIASVARRAKVDPEVAGEVLARHGVRESSVLPKPHRLLVHRIEFSGEKSGKSSGPVRFAWELGAGLWCVTADNLRGKSSILEIIWWCLRGSDALQADVRNWIQHVRLDAEVDGEPFTVRVDTTGDQLEGSLSVGAHEHTTAFRGSEFAAVMGAFMMDRLGLEHLRGWRRDGAAASEDGEEGPDGQMVLTSWPAFSHALLCRNRENDALIGTTASGGTMVSLLQMYVGLPWTTTRRDSSAALSLVQQSMKGTRRRAQQDLRMRGETLQQLEDELARARESAAKADTSGPEAAAEAVEQAAARLAAVSAQHADLVQRSRQTQQTADELHEAVVQDQARLRDLRETAAAQRFFGALKPTCCPACSTTVDQMPHADLGEDRCRVCGSHAAPSLVDVSAATELERSIAELKTAHGNAKRAAREAAAAVARSDDDIAQARASLTAAKALMPQGSAWRAHLDLARLEGRVQERREAEQSAVRPSGLTLDEAVLNAANKEADKRARTASTALLDNVSAEICRLGVRLGVEQLQEIKLRGNGTMVVTKGDSQSTFTAVTPGEQVRLRIATLLALLRVGNEFGVGRHPGLLLLDSPGAQETINADLAEVLGQLGSICAETPGLQVITATAKRDVASAAVPPERLKAVGPGKPVW